MAKTPKPPKGPKTPKGTNQTPSSDTEDYGAMFKQMDEPTGTSSPGPATASDKVKKQKISKIELPDASKSKREDQKPLPTDSDIQRIGDSIKKIDSSNDEVKRIKDAVKSDISNISKQLKKQNDAIVQLRDSRVNDYKAVQKAIGEVNKQIARLQRGYNDLSDKISGVQREVAKVKSRPVGLPSGMPSHPNQGPDEEEPQDLYSRFKRQVVQNYQKGDMYRTYRKTGMQRAARGVNNWLKGPAMSRPPAAAPAPRVPFSNPGAVPQIPGMPPEPVAPGASSPASGGQSFLGKVAAGAGALLMRGAGAIGLSGLAVGGAVVAGAAGAYYLNKKTSANWDEIFKRRNDKLAKANGPRPTMASGQMAPNFSAQYHRAQVDDQNAQFMKFGQLPPGFEFLPGHMGRLGMPGAVAARGAQPLTGGIPSLGRNGGSNYSPPSSYSPSPSYTPPATQPQQPQTQQQQPQVQPQQGPRMNWGGNMGRVLGTAPQQQPQPQVQPQAPQAQPQQQNNQTNYGEGNPLQLQRSRFAEELSKNPALKERVMALALAETGNSSSANRGLIETMMNRATAYGQPLSHRNFGEAYYEPMMRGGGAYNRALAQVRNNPQLKARLENDLAEVLKGSNVSNYGTQNSSAGVAASARRNQTITRDALNKEDRKITNGETWSRKDKPGTESIHGAGIIKKEGSWYRETEKAMREWEARQKGQAEKPADTPPKEVKPDEKKGTVDFGPIEVVPNRAPGASKLGGPMPTNSGEQASKKFLVLPGVGGTYGAGGKDTFREMAALHGAQADFLDGKWGLANSKSPQIAAAIEKLQKGDYHGIIGYSAGGYNMKHIFEHDDFKKLPQAKQDQIKTAIAMGVPGMKELPSQFGGKVFGDPNNKHHQTPSEVLKIMQQGQPQTPASGTPDLKARSLAGLMKTGGPDSIGDPRTVTGGGALQGPAVSQYAPRSTGMGMGLNSTQALIKQGMTPRLAESIFEGSKVAFGDPNDSRTRYVVQIGNAARNDPGSKHGQGKAADYQIFDRQTGKLVGGDMGSQSIFKNAFNNPETFRMYEVLSQGQYKYLHDKYGAKEADRLTSGLYFKAGRSGDLGKAEFRKDGMNPKIDNMHTSYDEHGQYGSVKGGLNDKAGKQVKDWLKKHNAQPSQPMGDPTKWKSPYHPDNQQPQNPNQPQAPQQPQQVPPKPYKDDGNDPAFDKPGVKPVPSAEPVKPQAAPTQPPGPGPGTGEGPPPPPPGTAPVQTGPGPGTGEGPPPPPPPGAVVPAAPKKVFGQPLKGSPYNPLNWMERFYGGDKPNAATPVGPEPQPGVPGFTEGPAPEAIPKPSEPNSAPMAPDTDQGYAPEKGFVSPEQNDPGAAAPAEQAPDQGPSTSPGTEGPAEAPNFRNNPESAPESPGSGGQGSYGRCFV